MKHLGHSCRLSILILQLLFVGINSAPADKLDSQPGVIQLCGLRSAGELPFGHNRIVGGSNAEKNEFKWQISIRLGGAKGQHICGAAIIGESWIITAAHCTIDFSPSYLTFVAGEHLINRNDGSEQARTSDLFIEHERYNDRTQENDVALVRLKKPFDYTTFKVAPVCLPEQDQVFTGPCVVTGWGKQREDGRNANTLMKVWIPIVSDTKCKTELKKVGYSKKIPSSMICAGYDAGGKDACQGDSGGPFVCPSNEKLPVLAGVVSWGIGCARKGVPGVYTEISHYVSWINKKVNKNTKSFIVRQPGSDSVDLADIEQQHKRMQVPIPSESISANPFIWLLQPSWSTGIIPVNGWLPAETKQPERQVEESVETVREYSYSEEKKEYIDSDELDEESESDESDESDE